MAESSELAGRIQQFKTGIDTKLDLCDTESRDEDVTTINNVLKSNT